MNNTEGTSITLHFQGPFGWPADGGVPCVFDANVSTTPGIYLWTVPTPEGELVHYVGETGRTFATRLAEHLKDQLSGVYRTYEPSLFARGEKRLLWGGISKRDGTKKYAEFVSRFEELASDLGQFVRMMNFHLAPLQCDTRLRQRVEAAIADHLYSVGGVVGEFQDKDIRYKRSLSGEPEIVICSTSDIQIRGMQDRITACFNEPPNRAS